MRCIPNFPSIRFFFYLIFNISFQTYKECIHTRIERCKFGVTEKEHNLNIQNTRWTSSQQYSSKEEGVGGVEWGRFVAISPLQKNWALRIEGGVRNTRVSRLSLNSGEFTFYSCEDLG